MIYPCVLKSRDHDLILTSSSCPPSLLLLCAIPPQCAISWPRSTPGQGSSQVSEGVRDRESVWSGAFCNPNLCVCVCVRMAAIERPMNSTWRSFHYRRLWSLNNTLYRDTFTTGRSSSQLLLRLRYPDLRPVSLQSFVLLVGWQRSRAEMRSRASKQAKS